MLYTRLFAASAVLAQVCLAANVEKAPETPQLGTNTVHGCYNSSGELTLAFTDNFNTEGLCGDHCRTQKNKAVGASYSKECYCGDKYPPSISLTNDSQCNEKCPGFGDDSCGGMSMDGTQAFTVYNTGLVLRVADSDNSIIKPSTSSSAPSSSSAAATSVAEVKPTSATPTPSSTPPSSGGSNTVGIAVGVVVGVVALAAIGGVIFFIFRRRRNTEIEEEHRRNAAVNAFIHGGKAPSTAGSLSINDQRLDAVTAQRRASSGSLDDTQDYSRRILRVTNA